MSLYQIIKSLQQAQGSNAKAAILEANKDNELLKEYLRATYDPAISYYQKAVPKHGEPSGRQVGFDKMDIQHAIATFANRLVTGDAAKLAMKNWVEDQNSVEDQELCKLLISRSVGAGVGDTMILKVWPDLYFIPPYQRCSLMDEKIKDKFATMPSFYTQLKCDGSFSYLVQEQDGEHYTVTRNGTRYPQWFSARMLPFNFSGMVAVGEIEVYATEGSKAILLDRQTGNGILNSILKGAEEHEYPHLEFVQNCWDLLTICEWKVGKSSRPYTERLKDLQNFEGLTSVESYEVKSLEEAYKIYSKFTSEGKEGAVIKAPNSLWKDGTAKDIVKLKIAFEADYLITGIYEGEGKAKGMLGGIIIETSDGLLKNNCGSGFSDDLRKHLWKPENNPVGSIVTVIANDVVTKRGSDVKSLFLPIFSDIRFDKTEADSLECVMQQLNSAKGVGA